jgi:hypothetical protein
LVTSYGLFKSKSNSYCTYYCASILELPSLELLVAKLSLSFVPKLVVVHSLTFIESNLQRREYHFVNN